MIFGHMVKRARPYFLTQQDARAVVGARLGLALQKFQCPLRYVTMEVRTSGLADRWGTLSFSKHDPVTKKVTYKYHAPFFMCRVPTETPNEPTSEPPFDSGPSEAEYPRGNGPDRDLLESYRADVSDQRVVELVRQAARRPTQNEEFRPGAPGVPPESTGFLYGDSMGSVTFGTDDLAIRIAALRCQEY